MENDIYEVDREEYKTFLGQLDTTKTHLEESWEGEDSIQIIKVVSDKSNIHLCGRIRDYKLEKERYFIFNYPDADERLRPKPVLHLTLNSREEVQDFFNAISELQKAHKHD